MARPDEISEDLWNTAADIALAYVEWLSVPNLDADAEDVLTIVVLRALVEERERCSEAANHFTTARNVRRARELTAHEVYEVKIFARLIGAAIRNPSFPKPANMNFASVPHNGEIA